MTYAKIDDGIYDHPKFAALSEDAMDLFVRGIVYCNRNLTDGLIARSKLGALSGRDTIRASAAELVAAGVWVDGPTGWVVRDFLQWNDSRETVLRRRNEARERMTAHRAGDKVPAKPEGTPGARSQDVRTNNDGTFAGGSGEVHASSSSSSGSPSGTSGEKTPLPPASGGSDAGRTLGGEPATPPEAPAAPGLAPPGKTLSPTLPPTENAGDSNAAIASPARKSRRPSPEASPDVRALFAHWQTAMDSPRSVLDGKRASRLAWGLATFGAETCRAAIDGCASSPYHRGENETGTVYRSIGLIFRSVDHVERFAAMVAPARRGHGRADCDGPLDAFVAQEFPPVTPPPRLPGAPSVARVVVEDSPALREATEQRRTMLRAQAAALLALQPEVTDGR